MGAKPMIIASALISMGMPSRPFKNLKLTGLSSLRPIQKRSEAFSIT
jgi:hypothetical protein